MKNWQDTLKWTGIGLAVTAAYALALLTLPVLLMSVCGVHGELELPSLEDFIAVNELFLEDVSVFPVLLVSLITAQVVMLSLSLSLTRGKLRSRWQLLVPLITAGLLMAQLHFWGMTTIFIGIWEEHGLKYMFFGLEMDDSASSIAVVIIEAVFLCIVWTLVFWRLTRTKEPVVLVKYLLKWLAAGSVIILFVTIVMIRVFPASGYDFIPQLMISFLSVIAGLGVLLLCIAPWLILRFRRRQPHPAPPESPATEPREQP